MIRFENVSKVYKGDVVALRDVSARRPKGRVRLPRRAVGLREVDVPASCCCATRSPRAGRIVVAGRDISQPRHWKVPQLRRNIGCVFQDFKLLPNKTVYENVAFALEVIGRPAPRRAHAGARRSSTSSA